MEDLILDALVALSIPTTIFVIFVVWENLDDVFPKKKEEEDPRLKESEEYKVPEAGRWWMMWRGR